MKQFQSKKIVSLIPLYVLLIPLFAPLALYTNNLGEVTLSFLWRPLLLSLFIGILIYSVSFVIIKDWQKSGLITILVEIFFFSYGHAYQILQKTEVFGVVIGRHRYLLVISFLIIIFGFWVVNWRIKEIKPLTMILNLVLLMMVLIQILQISFYEIRNVIAQSSFETVQTRNIPNISEGEKRDVYLIVLDGYMRSDWLQDKLGYDNSDFIGSLENRGFYTASCSRSNYSFTRLTMTSQLNFSYLQDLFDDVENDIYLRDKIKNNDVREIFSDLGYDFVTFENFYPWLNITDSDYYIKPENVSNINTFDLVYLETTILSAPYDLYEQETMAYRWSPENEDTTRYATLVQFILDFLKNPSNNERPVFVYAHILSPHYPYIFNGDGSINYDWEKDKDGSLRSTYAYLDSEILTIVSNLIKNSDPEPIIILQSDHGLGENNYKHLNLNSYYLPDGGVEQLYPTISPVNTFRVIFNHYFNMDFPLLEDVSYHSEKENGKTLLLVEDPYEECRINE